MCVFLRIIRRSKVVKAGAYLHKSSGLLGNARPRVRIAGPYGHLLAPRVDHAMPPIIRPSLDIDKMGGGNPGAINNGPRLASTWVNKKLRAPAQGHLMRRQAPARGYVDCPGGNEIGSVFRVFFPLFFWILLFEVISTVVARGCVVSRCPPGQSQGLTRLSIEPCCRLHVLPPVCCQDSGTTAVTCGSKLYDNIMVQRGPPSNEGEMINAQVPPIVLGITDHLDKL